VLPTSFSRRRSSRPGRGPMKVAPADYVGESPPRVAQR
jgi:hypothetical protein